MRVERQDWGGSIASGIVVLAYRAGGLINGSNIVGDTSGDRHASAVSRECLAVSALKGVLADDGLAGSHERRQVGVLVTLRRSSIGLSSDRELPISTVHRSDPAFMIADTTNVNSTPNLGATRGSGHKYLTVAPVRVHEVTDHVNHVIGVKTFVDGRLELDTTISCIDLVSQALEVILSEDNESFW